MTNTIYTWEELPDTTFTWEELLVICFLNNWTLEPVEEE